MSDLTIFAAAKALTGGALVATAFMLWSSAATPVPDHTPVLPMIAVAVGTSIAAVAGWLRDLSVVSALMLMGTGLVMMGVLQIPMSAIQATVAAGMLLVTGCVLLIGAAITDH